MVLAFSAPCAFSLLDGCSALTIGCGALCLWLTVWVLLQIKLDRPESARLMSLIGAVMMLWVVDGLVEPLTGYSVFGNPLIELDSEPW